MSKRSSRTTKSVNYAECSDSDTEAVPPTKHTSSTAASYASDSDMEVTPSKPINRSKAVVSSKKAASAPRTVQQYDAEIPQHIDNAVNALCTDTVALLQNQLTERLSRVVAANAFTDSTTDDDAHGIGHTVKKHIRTHIRKSPQYAREMQKIKQLKLDCDNLQTHQQLTAYVEPMQTFADVHLVFVR